MNRALRIAIAEDEALALKYFTRILQGLGHEVVAAVRSGRELIEQCRHTQPDLVITDIKMADMDGIDAAREVYKQRPLPIIIISAYDDPNLINRAEAEQIFAYLVKPIEESQLKTTIVFAMTRFHEFQELHRETDDLRQALKERKSIERAKGILMKQARIDEAAAFTRLQALAREQNRKLVEIAEMVVLANEAFEGNGR